MTHTQESCTRNFLQSKLTHTCKPTSHNSSHCYINTGIFTTHWGRSHSVTLTMCNCKAYWVKPVSTSSTQLNWLNTTGILDLRILRDSRKSWPKMVKRTWHTFVKIAKIPAVYTAANLLKLMVSNSRKIYILGKIHTTMMSRSHIPPVSNKARGLW